ncbi:hypothetical protein Fcan01_02480 [Folsomia candida]|uniref:Uncharacterized protein n=2 Tax=Folsomia candida TaxID=158441 RepID=A0A226EYK0_FOLCA|nr:hypothetical protein Fcan01_02480 [Folsomia candida]
MLLLDRREQVTTMFSLQFAYVICICGALSATSTHSLTRRQSITLWTRSNTNGLLQSALTRPAAAAGINEIGGNGNRNKKSTIPDARPLFEERLFVSPTVESVIEDVSSRISDPSLRQIFRNCLPSTLDTTVLWHRPRGADYNFPYTYIITGDIASMWLRDSTYQIHPYVPLAKDDDQLRELVLGVINTQAEMINIYPFGNAYFPLDHWNSNISLSPPDFGKDDQVFPYYNREKVFEAKYELDSLASFLYLTKYYFEETGNSDFLDNPNWENATRLVLSTMKLMQRGTLENYRADPYKFTRPTRTHTETQNLYGIGNPAMRCGLIRSFFRPSDDSTILQYLVPSNAMAVVGLYGVSYVLDSTGRFPELSEDLKVLANEVDTAIKKQAIVHHPEFGRVFAYEVDCYGSHVFMDDANFPSLLSLPKFGYVAKDDPIYINTRKYILSADWNPYYTKGKYAGVGSPHTGLQQTWHMSLCMQGMTSTDEFEIHKMLWTLRNTTANTGLM